MIAARLALVALAGCAGFIEGQAASSTLRILESSQVAARRLGDLEIARAALAGGIVQLDAFALAYPSHRRFAELHADAVCDFATAFAFDDWEDASLGGRAEDARVAGERLRLLLRDCIGLQDARLPHGWTPETLRRTDVPAALAIARARAQLVAIDSTPVVAPMAGLAELPALRALLERCAMLWPGYHDADAELLLGALAAGASVFTHDDGRAWFAKAASLAGDGVLTIPVVHARTASVATGDRAAFEAELARVTSADLSRWPEHRLANTLAVRKARRYLAHEAVLFP